jgi:hypothetical protein
MTRDKETTDTALAVRPSGTGDGIDRVREILLGDIVAELERRLARLDYLITHRNQELHHDVRTRTDVLEAHVRKELEVQLARAGNDTAQLNDALRIAREENREAITRVEKRLTRLEERFESAIARVERETREQLLAQAKTFIEELERMRTQLRAGMLHELGIDQDSFEEEGGHAGASSAPH